MKKEDSLLMLYEKLARYGLFKFSMVPEPVHLVNSFTIRGRHILIEYDKFDLPKHLRWLKEAKLFVAFELKGWSSLWHNEYPYSMRENVLRNSMHLVHDWDKHIAVHIDRWNPAQNSLMHLIYDVILDWS